MGTASFTGLGFGLSCWPKKITEQSALQADRSAGYPNYFNKKLEVDAARPAINAASIPLSGVCPAQSCYSLSVESVQHALSRPQCRSAPP